MANAGCEPGQQANEAQSEDDDDMLIVHAIARKQIAIAKAVQQNCIGLRPRARAEDSLGVVQEAQPG